MIRCVGAIELVFCRLKLESGFNDAVMPNCQGVGAVVDVADILNLFARLCDGLSFAHISVFVSRHKGGFSGDGSGRVCRDASGGACNWRCYTGGRTKVAARNALSGIGIPLRNLAGRRGRRRFDRTRGRGGRLIAIASLSVVIGRAG